METLNILISGEKKQKYMEEAEKAGKTLEQYLFDKVEGAPRGYSIKDAKIVVQETEEKELKAVYERALSEIIPSKESEAVQAKLNRK